jgi:DnaJ-domain-containing protein 1
MMTIAKADADKLSVVQTLSTERGARTMTLDPVAHRIYLATAKFDENAKDERGRPKIIEGTFTCSFTAQDHQRGDIRSRQ